MPFKANSVFANKNLKALPGKTVRPDLLASLYAEASQPPAYANDPLVHLGAAYAINNPVAAAPVALSNSYVAMKDMVQNQRDDDWRGHLKTLGSVGLNALMVGMMGMKGGFTMARPNPFNQLAKKTKALTAPIK